GCRRGDTRLGVRRTTGLTRADTRDTGPGGGVAGPLRLLDGDFPHREVMRGIADHNAAAALALLPR
ncbi:hypothetical protein ACWDN9_18310, partial [Streptomyces nigra]